MLLGAVCQGYGVTSLASASFLAPRPEAESASEFGRISFNGKGLVPARVVDAGCRTAHLTAQRRSRIVSAESSHEPERH